MNLPSSKKEIIENFHKLKKPLLIYGSPGCGKTYLANELLKDTVLLRIDLSLLKGIHNCKEYILDRLKKRNVTLMFHNKNEQRGLLIDDIHIFYKYDKSSYKLIIELIKEGKYYGSKIILTCCNTFLKNKYLCKLKLSKYEIKYNKSEYYKLCLEILKDKKIKLSDDKYDTLIYYSNYNLNKFNSNLDNLDKIDKKDNFDPIEKVTMNLLTNKYSLNEILRLCENDEIIIGFNLLENCLLFINNYEKTLFKIYEYYTISDNIETFTIKNQNNLMKNYSMGLSICMIHYLIHQNYKINYSKIIYNKYISRSMANTISLTIYNTINCPYTNILIYLFYTYNRLKLDKYKEKIFELYNQYPKEIINSNKKFQIFYNEKINLKMMCQ